MMIFFKIRFLAPALLIVAALIAVSPLGRAADLPAPAQNQATLDPRWAQIEPLLSAVARRGAAALRAHHPQEAVKALKPVAGPADPSAELMLAHALWATATPGQEDQALREGFAWAARSAAQGFAVAQAELAWDFEIGGRVPRDYQLAARLYRQAADQGYASGKRGLVRMTSSLGKWADAPPAPAEKAGEEALLRLDFSAALANFTQAANAQSPSAMFALAMLKDGGFGGPRDLAATEDWLTRAARLGYPPAAFALAERGSGKLTPEQLDWLKKAAEAGFTGAIFSRGLYTNAGVNGFAKDEAGGWELIKKAAALDDTFAKVAAARVYFEGVRGAVAQDRPMAYRLAREAYQDGNNLAGEELSQFQRAEGAH